MSALTATRGSEYIGFANLSFEMQDQPSGCYMFWPGLSPLEDSDDWTADLPDYVYWEADYEKCTVPITFF